MIDGFPFRIEVPSQGVSVPIEDTEALKAFINAELAFFQQLSGPLSQQIIVGQTNYNSVNINSAAERALGNILSGGAKGQFSALIAHLEQAERLEVLIAHGRIGEMARSMIKRGDNECARWLVYITCSGWTLNSPPDKILSAFRAGLFASPAVYSFGDLTSSTKALEDATRARASIEQSRAELDGFIKEKTELFDRLEDIYRNKLTLEEPAISWKGIADRKTKVWVLWLAIFALLVILPIVTIVYQWPLLLEAVAKLTPANGNFSFAGLAIVTIPALLYGWLLKNVSRIFIHKPR
jgi:hypothetical protein